MSRVRFSIFLLSIVIKNVYRIASTLFRDSFGSVCGNEEHYFGDLLTEGHWICSHNEGSWPVSR